MYPELLIQGKAGLRNIVKIKNKTVRAGRFTSRSVVDTVVTCCSNVYLGGIPYKSGCLVNKHTT